MALKSVSDRRVSTEEQGKSGVGLDAQARAFTQFIEDQGGEIIAEFMDERSGKHDDRPGLIKAMVFAKKHNEENNERRKADAEPVQAILSRSHPRPSRKGGGLRARTGTRSSHLLQP